MLIGSQICLKLTLNGFADRQTKLANGKVHKDNNKHPEGCVFHLLPVELDNSK